VQSFLKNLSTILISLILAVLVWIAAVRQQNPPREGEYNQNIPIEVIPPAAELVTTDPLPETIRLRLLAPESSWTTLTSSKFKASIDLSELEEGFNDVPIRVNVSDRQIEIIEQIPNVVSINLEALQTISLPVQIEVLDAPPLGYINRAPTADPPIIIVAGPTSLISQVGQAVSTISIGNSKETIQSVRDVLIRNREEQVIRGLEINPSKVQITLPIEQRFGYKDVSVRVIVDGRVAPGYRVSNISVTPPTLTVVGNPEGLSAIAGYIETTPINLNQATENIVRVVPLNLPNGVTTVLPEQENSGPGGVQVTVEVTAIEDGITLQRPITQQGIDPDYWWRASPEQADVFLSGPLTRLQALRASDVKVIVDLFGLEPGAHQLQPTVFPPDGLRVDAILPEALEITIGRTIQHPITQQKLESGYTWTVSPDRVDLFLLGAVAQLQTIRPTDVRVIVNLAGLKSGIYKVNPMVSLPDGLTLDSISPETVDVIIALRPRPTVTPVPTSTITVTSTLSVDKTATPQSEKED
jgi:YbbR domain-containing protein